MKTVRSSDGTTIAYDQWGEGPPLIFVGGNRKTTQRMGFRAATTLADALEMAKDTVGSSPSITYQHAPPLALADVR